VQLPLLPYIRKAQLNNWAFSFISYLDSILLFQRLVACARWVKARISNYYLALLPMELQTVPRTYLVPVNSQAINKALAALAALGLSHEMPRAVDNPAQTLFALVVQVPVIPVVHYFDLFTLRQEIITDRQKRTERPSHREASNWSYGNGAIATAYPDAFFSPATQAGLTYSVTDLIIRERIIQHFAAQEITVQKITLSKPANEVLSAPRIFSQQDAWYAFVEEARPVMPELAVLLGAV
jgi:hypothetical protein